MKPWLKWALLALALTAFAVLQFIPAQTAGASAPARPITVIDGAR